MKSTDQKPQYQQSFRVIRDAQDQIREIVECQMRGAAISMIQQLFSEEVEKLCGPTFSRKSSKRCHRGGSDPGRVLLHGQQVSVKKPRVKKAGKEVELESYSALQNYDLLCDRVMNHMLSGVSTRNYEPLLDDVTGGTGLKKSTVSSAFVAASKEQLEALNGRDLSEYDFTSIMLDGVGYGDRTVVVALGITSQGKS